MPTIGYDSKGFAPTGWNNMPVVYNADITNPNQLFQQGKTQPTNWYNYLQQQVMNYGNQLTDFNSPIYTNFAKYLQSTMPQITANTLMSPLIASGASYESANNIGKTTAKGLAQNRLDTISKTVDEFALGNFSQIPNLFNQFGGNLNNQQQITFQNDQLRSQNSISSGLGNMFGSLLGLFSNPLFNGGAGGAGGISGGDSGGGGGYIQT